MRSLGSLCGLASIILIVAASDPLNAILYANVGVFEYFKLVVFILGANFFLQSSIDFMVNK